jgi:hypothetical protein
MKKPSWISLLIGIVVWAVFSLATHVTMHRVYSTDDLARAIESGIAGGTALWLFGLIRWKRSQPSEK